MNGRYEPVELPRDERGRPQWAIKDHKHDGQLVEDDGDTICFFFEWQVRDWILSQTSLDNAGAGRA